MKEGRKKKKNRKEKRQINSFVQKLKNLIKFINYKI